MIEWYTRDGGTVGFRVIDEQRNPAMTTNKTEQDPCVGEEITNSSVDYKFLREYFEVGCLCILRGEVQKLGEELSDKEAVEIYDKECKCSRHPEYGRGLFISGLDTK